MFSTVLGFFSTDLAVDLGTSNTRIWMRGKGVVCQEPTVLAVHTDPRGRRRVLAVGNDALPMLGRTPGDIRTVQPVKDGQIVDYEAAQALLLHLVRRVHGRNGWASPRMVIAVPHSATDTERRAVRESCEGAGAREVHLVTRLIAAALGAELPVDQPSGHMIVDVGGGSTEIAVLSLHGVVASTSVPGGGAAMDDAIIAMVRERHELLVGRPTAERLKIELGVASDGDPSLRSMVAGRCLRTGVPRACEVSADDIARALFAGIDAIAVGVRSVLERTPPSSRPMSSITAWS